MIRSEGRIDMELDQALGFAVILGWDDLKKYSDPCSARVEYRSAPGTRWTI